MTVTSTSCGATDKFKKYTCRCCGCQFHLLTKLGLSTRGLGLHVVDPNGYFCTDRCARQFAVAAIEHFDLAEKRRVG